MVAGAADVINGTTGNGINDRSPSRSGSTRNGIARITSTRSAARSDENDCNRMVGMDMDDTISKISRTSVRTNADGNERTTRRTKIR